MRGQVGVDDAALISVHLPGAAALPQLAFALVLSMQSDSATCVQCYFRTIGAIHSGHLLHNMAGASRPNLGLGRVRP